MSTTPFHVVVATPILGAPTMEYAYSLAMLCLYFAQNQVYPGNPNQAIKILAPEEGCVLSQNRERLADRALAVPGMTHLLFIDADMAFEPSVLHVLASRRQPYVACNYPLKQEQLPDFSAMRKDREGRIWTRPDSTGLEEAYFTGFGMALIERRVLETLPKPRFPIVWGKQNQQWSTEDAPFCAMCWSHGFPVYVDHDASQFVWHIGRRGYKVKETSDGIARRMELEAQHRAEGESDGGGGDSGVQHPKRGPAPGEPRRPAGLGGECHEEHGDDSGADALGGLRERYDPVLG